MEITSVKNLNFGSYSAPIKTLFLEGAFGNKVTRGFYGEYLTRNNVSLEHLKPHSMGGKASWGNLVLDADWCNRHRGVRPLRKTIVPQQAIAYLEQFRGIVIPGRFRGDDYIRLVTKTLEDMKISLFTMALGRRAKIKPHKMFLR